MKSPWKRKPSKYRNTKCEADGLKFDSQKEAARYRELKLLQEAGEISGLTCQNRFTFTVNGNMLRYVGSNRPVTYICDFRYVDKNGVEIVEDVKSPVTITPVYKLKKALMAAIHGITIKETMNVR